METRQVRSRPGEFAVRSDGDELKICGYFAVFGSDYEIAPDMSESIAPGAFTRTLNENPDVRALVNHDTTLVLGRTTASTLALREDDHGLYGEVSVNPKDVDAMNLYERVKRGDVDQCSFGFEIVSEDTDVRADHSMHWTIRDVNLYEVSVCTFPAYQETSVSARSAERDAVIAREREAWKVRMRKLLKGEKTDA